MFYLFFIHMYSRIQKNIESIIKWFLWLLLLQFFLHTFVTYSLWFSGSFWSVVWMRKEILVLVLIAFVARHLFKKIDKEELKAFRNNFPLKLFILVFLLTNIIIFTISLFNSTVFNFLISIRYSMFGFFLFILFFLIWYFFLAKRSEKIITWYTKIIKRVLIWSLIWWWLIRLVPNLMRFVGYNQRVYEWKVWEQPPAVYYTQYKDWFVRNQFLFERPISLWFFLVAFWPLFFLMVLYKKWPKSWILWWWLYWLILLSTFSRAAWWAWLAQTIVMFLFLYAKTWKQNKKLLTTFLIWITWVLVVVTYYGKDQIIHREFSNTGHLKEVVIALWQIKESWFLGKWAASAGPASHHLVNWEAYNPENQFLQIWIEYGLIAFIWWMILYLYLHLIGFWAWKNIDHQRDNKVLKQKALVLLAFSLWIFGLSIEWLVLHSFVDRMIVYPFVTLFAIYYASFYQEKKHLQYK